ncbi:MAG: 50S ribosomal protein L9 [Firmicutes bacterium]|nr:50S ribosomal protein L9 [Bacillota bacterium]
MIVILQQDVKGTGKKGDVVKVSDGYARNVLIPKGIAKEATEGNVKSLNRQKEIAAEKNAAQKAAAEATAAKLNESSVTIKAKGGDGGRLFGSVTNKDVADAMKDQLGIKMDKKKIELKSAIKNEGEFTAKIRLFAGVAADLKVIVTIA